METVVHALVVGLYIAPVLNALPLNPPQIIITFPDQTAVWSFLLPGADVVEVAIHEFVAGLYLPPVYK